MAGRTDLDHIEHKQCCSIIAADIAPVLGRNISLEWHIQLEELHV